MVQAFILQVIILLTDHYHSTGHVSSPTVNDLPTAEDVEAMIESMRAGERSLPTDNGEQATSQGSAPPSVGSTQATMEMSPIQPPGSTASGMLEFHHVYGATINN